MVVQNLIAPHKLTSRFGKTEYEVMERIGNELTLSAEGKTIRRHTMQVKKLPEKEQNEPEQEQNDPKLPPLKLGKKEGMWRLIKEGASTGDKAARAD